MKDLDNVSQPMDHPPRAQRGRGRPKLYPDDASRHAAKLESKRLYRVRYIFIDVNAHSM
jgi:hypothetical protein